jgi:hypothetical protein
MCSWFSSRPVFSGYVLETSRSLNELLTAGTLFRCFFGSRNGFDGWLARRPVLAGVVSTIVSSKLGI